MGKPVPPQPVKLFTGVLYTEPGILNAVRMKLEALFGPLDYQSSDYPFSLTDYYEPEMGGGIRRQFWSFDTLIDPSRLAEIKLATNAVEADFIHREQSRRINLDPGYVDFYKMILASVKERAQKIYLDRGIYADPTLYYLKGKWYAYEWSLPDFRDDRYHAAFQEIRMRYRVQMRGYRQGLISFSGFENTQNFMV